MKYYVTFDCGFDENDGDECRNDGTLYHPIKGGTWIVDEHSQEDLKLLAIIFHYVYEKIGGEDESKTYGDVSEEAALELLVKDEFLQKLGVTEAEIKKAVESFWLGDYFPHKHCDAAEPHDHWFNLSIEPVENTRPSLTDDFLLKSWQSAQGGNNA